MLCRYLAEDSPEQELSEPLHERQRNQMQEPMVSQYPVPTQLYKRKRYISLYLRYVNYCWWVVQSYLALWPHGLQHARLPCPSLSPRVCLNSCLLSQWCHPTISSPLLPPAPPTLNLSQHQSLFRWVGSLHQVAKYWSFSISPSNEYSEFIFFGLTGLISLQSKGLSKVFSRTIVWKHQFFSAQPSLWSNSHIHTWLLEKP